MPREHRYYVYIMQSPSRRVLYIGVTSDIEKRVFQHKNHLIEGFSSKYNTTRLVYLERFVDIRNAIARETQLKKWRRSKKEWLIQMNNPHWRDLAEDWYNQLTGVTKGSSTPLRSARHDNSEGQDRTGTKGSSTPDTQGPARPALAMTDHDDDSGENIGPVA